MQIGYVAAQSPHIDWGCVNPCIPTCYEDLYLSHLWDDKYFFSLTSSFPMLQIFLLSTYLDMYFIVSNKTSNQNRGRKKN